MVDSADIHGDPGLTRGQYFGLVADGHIQPTDRVELLDGVVVAMSPQNPPHAAAVCRADAALRRSLPSDTVIRIQSPLVLDERSVPEPDLAVVPGTESDYDHEHPTTASLVIEVADTSLAQDRITKTRIYAGAGIAEVWIVNLRESCVETFQHPDSEARTYRSTSRHQRGDLLQIASFPSATIRVEELLPTPK